MREVASEAIRRGLAGLALVHDCKHRDVQQYDGTARFSVADLAARPLTGDDDSSIVFRPGPDGQPPLAEVCTHAFRVAAAGIPVVFVADELYHGVAGGIAWADPVCGRVFREGSSQGISTLWTTQIPQMLPTEANALTETVALFRLQRRSRAYAARAFDLDAEADALLPSLGRGEFLLITPDGWDGKVYGPT